MKHTFRGFLALVCLVLAATAGAAAVRYDMTKAELLQELGKPTSTMQHPSGREVLLYPKGVRIELERGVVVSVKGLDLAAEEAKAVSASSTPTDSAPPPSATPEELQAAASEATEMAKAEKQLAEESAQARAEVEKVIERMENPHLPAEPVADETLAEKLKAFLIEVFVKWALMLAALKLTCKYWNADVSWSGLMIAAGADTAVRVVCALLANFLLDIDSLLFADEALAAIVLVLVLRKVSTNQSLPQAVTITLTSKVFSIVVGSFLTVVILNAAK